MCLHFSEEEEEKVNKAIKSKDICKEIIYVACQYKHEDWKKNFKAHLKTIEVYSKTKY